MNITALRISGIVLAFLTIILGVIMFLVEHSLIGVWFLPMIFILLLLVWSPWKTSSKRKSN